MWHGLRTIMYYKVKAIASISADAAFADKLNIFYTRFETSGAASATYHLTMEESDVIRDEPILTIAESDVRAALKWVNNRKAAGPDSISGHLLH